MKQPIRVLQILDRISYNSGVSSVVMNYYTHIDRNQIIFDFMVNEEVPESIKKKIEVYGSKIYQMPQLCLKNSIAYLKELDAFFKEHKAEYQIIHGHVPNASVFYLAVAKKHGIPVRILHSHNVRGADQFYKRVRNRILSLAGIQFANEYFACSRMAGEYLYGKHGKWIIQNWKKRLCGDNKKRIHILHNAIDIEKFFYNPITREDIRRKFDLEDSFVLGCVGRLCYQKNQEFLIEILSKLEQEHDSYVLFLVGDGEEKKKLKRLAKEKKLVVEDYSNQNESRKKIQKTKKNRVIFAGITDNVGSFLQSMDLFLIPSRFEGLSIVCMEAQMAGLPCIISEHLPEDVQIDSDICILPLKTELWILNIKRIKKQLNEYGQERRERCKKKAMNAQKAGYEIKQAAVDLTSYYLNMNNSRKRER